MTDIGGLEVKSGVLGPSDVWKSKDDFVKREQTSLEEWPKMSEEERLAVIDMVDKALDRLKDHLENWVPSSLEVKSGQYLDVSFRILFSELESHVRSLEDMSDRAIRNAAARTKKLLGELESGV